MIQQIPMLLIRHTPTSRTRGKTRKQVETAAVLLKAGAMARGPLFVLPTPENENSPGRNRGPVPG